MIDAKRIVREIRLLKFFDHENIIKVLDVAKPPSPTGYEDIYIITELMETDMHRVIYSRQDLTDDHLQYFMFQVLTGSYYMHTANIIHRDLKPSNLLLNKDCTLKICDFGLARGYEETTTTLTEYVVTRWYRAPEVILNASHYTNALDVWSLGCIFAELLGRAPLFPGDDYLDQIKRTIAVLGTPTSDDMSFIGNDLARKYIRKLPKRNKQSMKKIFPKANPNAHSLLQKMLVFNPEKRYTVKNCLEHPYFEKLFVDINLADNECVEPFDWAWDNFEPTKDKLQRMVWDESLQ